MQLTSINIGRPRSIEGQGRTGIFKMPVEGPVALLAERLDGDAICDARYHGGPDQAVYIYTVPDYDWWARELGHEIAAGTFGENLTITGIESAGVLVGDRFRVGPVVVEATAPRIPCGKFSARMEDPGFAERFRRAERPGFYCRVVESGRIAAGDTVIWERYAGDPVTMLELFRSYYTSEADADVLRRHLAAPIAARARVHKEKQLAKHAAPGQGVRKR